MLKNVIVTMILLCLFLLGLIILNLYGIKESINLYVSMLIFSIAILKLVDSALYILGSVIMLLGILICINELMLFTLAALGAVTGLTLVLIYQLSAKRWLPQ